MTTTTANRVFPHKRESVLRSKKRPLLGGRIGKSARKSPQSIKAALKAVAESLPSVPWISELREHTQTALQAVLSSLGSLVDLLQTPKATSLPPPQVYKFLPPDELKEVLLAPEEVARDVFMCGAYDAATKRLLLRRGDFTPAIVPVSFFRPSGTTAPDPTALAVTDYGHTIKLGDYESSADVILYEFDPDYRRRINARRRAEDKGFGPSLRRLRIQRRVKRTDFPGISPKTIARIERGETAKPHGKTLTVIASTLGVEAEEIETY